MHFVKGHGTGNDFVLLPDPDGALALTPARVAAICDRRRGLGADGVLRVVRTAKADEHPGVEGAEWFMDYRNADGSPAEMCGNGIRVYARYLLDAGLAAPGEIPIATRAGVRTVTAEPGGEFSVDMGTPAVAGTATVRIGGTGYDGVRVSLGNPHLACVLDEPVHGFDLSTPPEVGVDAFPAGANVELVRVLAPAHIEMRVHERGVGETLSCGTGAVAGAAAAAHAADAASGRWRVDVPGGTLTVILDGGTGVLAGPAVLVAEGRLREEG